MAYRSKRRLGGLGEYPGYYCYDANRPSWLPYWIDSVNESMCRWNPKTVGGNLYYCLSGDPSCSNPSEAEMNPALSGPGIAPSGSPSNVPVCGRFFTVDPVTNSCIFNVMDPSLLLLVGGVFALFLVTR